MKKKLALIGLLIAVISMAGCKEQKNEQPIIEVENQLNEEVTFAEMENSTPVEIVFINVSGVDIGMLSIIDPVAKEQMNVSSLANSASLSIKANWPDDVTIINWALYDKGGELCVEGSSNLTGIKESATIVLGGNGDVTDIKVQVN